MKYSKLLAPLTASLLVLALGRGTAMAEHESTSRQLEFGDSATRFLPRAELTDEFRFELTEPTRVHIETSKGTLAGRGPIDTAGEVLNSDGRVVARDDNSGAGGNFRIVEDLPPGSYVLHVRGNNRLAGGPRTERSNRYSVTLDHE